LIAAQAATNQAPLYLPGKAGLFVSPFIHAIGAAGRERPV